VVLHKWSYLVSHGQHKACGRALVQDLLGYRLDEAVDRAEAAGIVLTPSSSSTRLRALSASSAVATLDA